MVSNFVNTYIEQETQLIAPRVGKVVIIRLHTCIAYQISSQDRQPYGSLSISFLLKYGTREAISSLLNK